ncbi:unnamed protein product [Sphagnum jensenii]|uniref:Uncharacterized protein n=1 Tax=Sphagnum jensenii TaxID=128206 RepID=A0ABP0WDP4_9BRYO
MVVVTMASSAMASSSSAPAASSSCSSSLSSSALRVPHGIKLGFSRCPSSRSSRRCGNPHSQQVHNVHVSGSLKVPEFQVEFTRCVSSKSQHHCYWHHRFQKLRSATQYNQGFRRAKTLDNVFSVSCSRNDSTSIEDRIPGLKDEPTSRVTNGSQNGEVGDGKLVENPLANLDIKVSAVIEVAENLAAISIEGVHATAEVAAETLEVAVTTLSEIGEVERISSAESGNADDDAAVRTVIFWVGLAVAFGTFLFFTEGTSKASEFFAGYLLEQSLSVDNLFVFVLIFNYFQVPQNYQSRVLMYGIAGAVVFRAIMIALGAATLQQFEAVNLVFAGILLFSSYKLFSDAEEGEEDLSDNFIIKISRMFVPITSTYDGNKFFTKTPEGVRMATPLLLTLVVLELSDIAFAVDSIPAVFGVTRDPLIVLSSNIFAVLGLRSLFTLISGSMGELAYLQQAVAAVLGFIGSKMVLDFFGFHVPTELSLAVVVTLLGAGVGFSLKDSPDEDDNSQG